MLTEAGDERMRIPFVDKDNIAIVQEFIEVEFLLVVPMHVNLRKCCVEPIDRTVAAIPDVIL